MDEYFKLDDSIQQIYAIIKKSKNYTKETKCSKIKQLVSLKNKLKIHILSTTELKQPAITNRYKEFESKINDAITLLGGTEEVAEENQNQDETD